jgi:hypothetical protein
LAELTALFREYSLEKDEENIPDLGVGNSFPTIQDEPETAIIRSGCEEKGR